MQTKKDEIVSEYKTRLETLFMKFSGLVLLNIGTKKVPILLIDKLHPKLSSLVESQAGLGSLS